jgi:hypothetical protein
MTEQAAAPAFDNRHYVQGRVALPPWLTTKKSKPFAFTGSALSIATAASGTVTIQIHDDSYFLVEQIQILSSDFTVNQDKATVQITDNSQSQSWSNIPIPVRDVAGLGWNPKYLSHPNMLRPTSTITFQIVNNNASTASYYVVIFGRKIYGVTGDEINILQRRMWYQYGLLIPSLGASAFNQPFNLNIYNESDFKLYRTLSQQAIDAIFANTGGAVSNEVMIQLRDTTNDTYLFSDYLPVRTVFGMMQGAQTSVANSWAQGDAFCFKKPWLLRRNGVIQATLTNLSTTAMSAGFILTFEGIRIFDAH